MEISGFKLATLTIVGSRIWTGIGLISIGSLALFPLSTASADDDLAKAVQNPIGSLISVPVETTFDFGAPDGGATFVNVQPVIPFRWGNINQFLIQPFVTYNLDDGWYLTSNPIMTANWNADSSRERWNIPLGGGIGKLHKFGNQPVNLRLESYYNVRKPTGAADWSARFTVQFLFPK